MRQDNPPDPVYAPNSFGGPAADPAFELPSWQVDAGEIARTAYAKHSDDDDFVQAGTLYRAVLSEVDRDHMVGNIVGHASDGVTPEMQQRVIAYWGNVDPNLGQRVAAGLGKRNGEPLPQPRSHHPAEGAVL
jgi:catalase